MQQPKCTSVRRILLVQDSTGTILYMYMYMYMYRYGMHDVDDYICINPELQNPDPMSCIPVACDSLYRYMYSRRGEVQVRVLYYPNTAVVP